jgi:hypothetical protein
MYSSLSSFGPFIFLLNIFADAVYQNTSQPFYPFFSTVDAAYQNTSLPFFLN